MSSPTWLMQSAAQDVVRVTVPPLARLTRRPARRNSIYPPPSLSTGPGPPSRPALQVCAHPSAPPPANEPRSDSACVFRARPLASPHPPPSARESASDSTWPAF
ncbi:hypothetical protein B0H17DRAFT_1071612 [Mycena rosella]|uniref:Uncharacterized protein n=1 Tax=Mycena rosella TaxID=1033263 RepID=A0AAD7GBJ6_MYCRO|nr:hypothetical protein B0H17DRAFT_1071612 [Mycena rosella]